MNYDSARENMIEQQIRPWDVLDQRALDTMASIPREFFLPDELKGLAFADTRLPVGFGRKMLNPNIEGRILQELNVQESDQILEIGTGNGYLTACLASLCRHIDSVEFVAELSLNAENLLKTFGISNFSVETVSVDGVCKGTDRYDAIVVNGSTPDIPSACRENLTVNGKMICFKGAVSQPVHKAMLITRLSETEWSEETLFETWMDPLVIEHSG